MTKTIIGPDFNDGSNGGIDNRTILNTTTAAIGLHLIRPIDQKAAKKLAAKESETEWRECWC